MKSIKLSFKKLLFFLVSFLVTNFSYGINSARLAKPRLSNAKWVKKHNEIEAKSFYSKSEVLFLGDSITEGWILSKAWRTYFSKNSFNAGISGDRTQHVLWRLQTGIVKRMKPKVVVLMIGTNNTLSNSPKAIAAGIKDIIHKIHLDSPKTKVLLMGIFPSGKYKNAKRRLENNKVNQLISQYDNQRSVFYWNVDNIFLEDDGSIDKTTMYDYLHLTRNAYQKLAVQLAPKVRVLLQ